MHSALLLNLFNSLHLVASIVDIRLSQAEWHERACGESTPPVEQQSFSMAHSSVEVQTAEFREWMAEHGRTYASHREFQAKLDIFRQNTLKVAKLNADEHDSAVYDMNSPFADMSAQEFADKVLLPKHSAAYLTAGENHTSPHQAAASNGTSESFSWVQHGAVSSVKDQGALGSCWAFSTVGNLEGLHFLASRKLVNLSVEQLIECDALASATHADCGVFGGWPFLAYQYIQRAGGLFSDASMPYCSGIPYGEPGACQPCMPESYNKTLCGNHADLYCNKSTTLGQGTAKMCDAAPSSKPHEVKLSGWKAVSTNEQQIAVALQQTAPLSVGMNAASLQFYRSGVFNPFFCNGKELDHAVLLVGFGTDGKNPYWEVKNSWGTKWGEDGYFRIKRGSGKCGINTQVTTGILA